MESILLIRLLAVYPFRTTPLKKFLSIFIPITLLKLARLANLIVYLVSFYDEIRTKEQTLSWVQELCSTRFPNYTVEFPLQVVDNTSTSVLFLVKLNEVRAFRSTVRGWSERSSFISHSLLTQFGQVRPLRRCSGSQFLTLLFQ